MRRMLLLLVVACGGGKSGQPDGGAALTPDEIQAACVAAYSCDYVYTDASKTVDDCIARLSEVPPVLTATDTIVSEFRAEQVRCLAAAGSSCTTALACIGITVGPFCSNDTPSSCSGTTVSSCQGGRLFGNDCAGGLWFTSDTTCVDTSGGTGRAACALATCSQRGVTCDGTRIVNCGGELDTVSDCAPYAMTCAASSQTCVGTGAACSASRCDGSTWVRCAGGLEARIDCAAMLQGGTCVDGVTGCGFDSACSTSDPATCNGNVLSTCVLGTPMTIDCAAAGYVGCSGGNCIPQAH